MSGFQLGNFLEPNAHTALEVSHAHAFDSWSELVDGSVGLDPSLGSIVLEVASSTSEHLHSGNEGLVLLQDEETIVVKVGVLEALIALSHGLLHIAGIFHLF